MAVPVDEVVGEDVDVEDLVAVAERVLVAVGDEAGVAEDTADVEDVDVADPVPVPEDVDDLVAVEEAVEVELDVVAADAEATPDFVAVAVAEAVVDEVPVGDEVDDEVDDPVELPVDEDVADDVFVAVADSGRALSEKREAGWSIAGERDHDGGLARDSARPRLVLHSEPRSAPLPVTAVLTRCPRRCGSAGGSHGRRSGGGGGG